MKSQLAPGSKGESAFDELRGTLDGYVAFNSEKKVKVIGHYDEFVELEFSLCSIVVQNSNEESGRAVGLQHGTFARDGRRDKECAGGSSYVLRIGISGWDRHSAAKAGSL